MTAEIAEIYLDDPAYQNAILHLQNGEWSTGLNELDQLGTSYPLSHQLRTLRQ